MSGPEIDFETLYRRYAADVYRFALYLTGRPEQAEDIAAETFVRAWMSPEPIRAGTVKAYLFTIARNLQRMDLRRARKHEPIDVEIRDDAPGPETSAAARLNLERLLGHLQRLSEVDRAVLIMRAEDGRCVPRTGRRARRHAAIGRGHSRFASAIAARQPRGGDAHSHEASAESAVPTAPAGAGADGSRRRQVDRADDVHHLAGGSDRALDRRCTLLAGVRMAFALSATAGSVLQVNVAMGV
jgi:RNA polymerase sigma factor (sigma-70 family)